MRIPVFIHLPRDELAPATLPQLEPARRLVRRALSRLGAFLRAWREERATLRLIAQMDEATLRDIGVTRFQLAEALRERRDEALQEPAAWRARP